MIKKRLSFVLLCSLTMFSCNKKEGFSIYVTSDFHRLIWDSGEKELFSLKGLKDSGKSAGIFIDAGGSFSQDHLENRHTGGLDTASVLADFAPDAVIMDSETLKLSAKELEAVTEKLGGRALSSNLYWKTGKTPETIKRHLIVTSGKTRVGLVSAILRNPEKPDKRSYYSGYKIENPIYEINRNMEKIKKDCDLKILVLNSDFEDLKKLKKNIESFFSLMLSKPDVMILSGTKTFDPFKLKNVWIIPSRFSSSLVFRAELKVNKNFKTKDLRISPLDEAKIKAPPPSEAFMKKVAEVRKKSADYFDKVISRTESGLEAEKDGYSPLGDVLADSIKNYIRSNGAVISYSAIKKNLKAGNIKVRDIYEMLDPEDNLTYTKVRGSDVPKLMEKIYKRKISVSGLKIYHNGKEITKILINGRPVNDGEIYRFLIPQSLINDDYSILSHSTEFSVLPRKTLDAAMWYFRSRKTLPRTGERRIIEE